jgi:two-component system, response regulator, stage 0 sporulation protein F
MKIKILYVDDEIINLTLFDAIFEKKFEVFIAENGIMGLEMLNNNPNISVVLSDMKMPKMNGFEFITQAKEKHPNINYYLLTGYDMNNEIQSAIDDGLILKCFRKPFNNKRIEDSIREDL